MTTQASSGSGDEPREQIPEDSSHPMPSGVVKAAGISIIPWTIGNLLSPFGEPHAVLLALPLLALVLLIVAAKLKLRVRRRFVPWTLAGLLIATSAIRFLVLPFVTELVAGSDEIDDSGRSIQLAILSLASVKIAFYLASLGIFVHSGWLLLTYNSRRE